MTELLLAAFLLGFLGSLHCVGMCGGLVTALSMTRPRIWWTGLMAYQAGRIITYTCLGILVGVLGLLIVNIAWFASVQRGLTLTAGMLMIIFGLTLAGWLPDILARLMAQMSARLGLSTWIQRASASRMPMSWLMVGLFNGLLPCGLVYAGLALSLGVADLLTSALMMLAFGLGTVPAMSLVPLVLRRISPTWRGRLLQLAALLLIGLGVLTMVRGSDWMHSLHGGQHQHHTISDAMPNDMNMESMEMP